MRIALFRITLALGVPATITTAACTVVSGVDDYELRKGDAPAPSANGDGGSPFAASPDSDAGSPSRASNPPNTNGSGAGGTGPATCGAEGSWTSCDPTASLDTCAMRCVAQGLTCVESCCAYDDVGDFAAAAGMVYEVAPAEECTVASISSQSQGGACTDPTILTAGSAAQVRCCCK